MSVSLQKANFWKRISAWLFDALLTVMLAVGIAAAVSAVLKYDSYVDKYQEYSTRYRQAYGLEIDITEEEYNLLSPEEQQKYIDADKAFGEDPEVQELHFTIFTKTLIIVTLGPLGAYLIIYFILPLCFKNGQTLGKKCFGIAVMRTNCVKITHPVLFVRSILGHYTIETMVPILLVTMMLFGILGGMGTIVLFLLLALQIGVMIATKTNSSIHDLLSDTVVVDMASQQIFDTEDQLIAYKQAEHEREVAALRERGLDATDEQNSIEKIEE